MKKIPQIACALSLLCAAVLHAAPASSPLEVIVRKDPGGTLAYQGNTDSRGMFATPNLAAGKYTVEFRSKGTMKGNASITIGGAKEPMNASVPGAKFAGGGVAMRVQLGKAGKLNGQVAPEGAAPQAKMESVKANVKVIKGKRHVWVPGPIGSNIAGRWVEEGTEGAVLRTDKKGGGEILSRIQEQSANAGQQPDAGAR
jgi:hypothetical protein